MELAKRLETDYKIIVEKYEANNVLFIVTFQNTKIDVERTISAIETEIPKMQSETLHFPKFPDKIEKKHSSFSVKQMAKESVALDASVGRVVGEDVVPYPPGIPLLVKGEVIHPEHITYLKQLRETKDLLTVIIRDETVNTITVTEE
jgi:arginine/lysine/ornithine decarboxylase